MKVPDIPLFITVDRYRMLRRIGQGARGVVYQADDLRTGRQVAIKFMVLAEDMSEGESHQRFEREAKLLEELSRHPHLVRFERAGTLAWRKQTLHFVAMEYLPGLRTLDQAMQEFGGPDWMLDRTEELLLTLEFMHSKSVIHRDLKPANLGIPEDRRLRVLDLGLARLSGSDLTNPGVFMGSLGYIAPEQVMDAKRVDNRSDLYSVGMILLEMLGGHPFRTMSSTRALRAVVEGRIPPTPEPLPEPLDSFARKLCACRPADRYQSAFEAVRDLQAMRHRVGGLGSIHPPPPGKLGGWDTLVSQLGEQLLLMRDGQGGAVLVTGQAEERGALLETVCQHAELMGIKVLRTRHSQQLAEALGCANDEQSLFESLSDGAEEQPTLVCMGDLWPGDGVLERVMQRAVRSGEPLLVVASTVEPPADAEWATVLSIR